MILFLRQVNSMGETLQFGYNFCAWQILYKNPFDLYIFLLHLKNGGKLKNNGVLHYIMITKNFSLLVR